MANCDECGRLVQCYQEGRLLTFMTLDDWQRREELGGDAHAILGIGETCPIEG